MALPWRLTGRAAELRRVRESLARREPGVLFAGAAGVGKTTVAREAEAAARAARRPTAWITATRAAAGIPLGALSGVLPAAAGRASSTTRLIGQAVTAIERLGTSRRALVCIDDAHLLDDVSAAVVHQLALRGEVTLVVTVRTEPAPDAVTALWKDGLLERTEIAGLSDPEMIDLLQAALGDPVETGARDRLLALADGNVLLLRHLVEGELAAGRLLHRQRCWYWRGGGVPERIGDLLRGQLSAVDDGQHEVLDLLAVAEPLPLATLDRVVGRAATLRAEAAGLVTVGQEAGTDAVRLGHPLYAEVLREALRPLRARELRTALVDALADVAVGDTGDGAPGDRMPDDRASGGGAPGETASGTGVPGHADPADAAGYWSLRRCVLALDSDAEVDAADLHAAAAAAMALLDEPLAERLCRAALRRSPSFSSRLRLGYSLIRQERRAEGAAVLRELADASSEIELAAAMRPIAASLFWDDDDPVQAQAVLDQTRATLRSGAARAIVDALRASFAAFLARGEQAFSLAESALAADGAGPAEVAWACAGACMAAAVVGQPRRVDALSPRGWSAALASDTERFLVLPLGNASVLAYGRAGELDRAAEAVDRFAAASGSLPSAQARSALLLFRGQLAWWRGDLPEAARLLEDAAFGFGDPPGAPTCWAVQSLLAAVMVHAARGDAVAARDALERLRRHDLSAMTIFQADVALATACVLAAEGSLAEAADRAFDAADIARRHGLRAAESEALHRTVRWGETRGADRLAELAVMVDGPRAAVSARQAVALAAGDAAGLAAAADAWMRMGAGVLAADAYAQAATVGAAGERQVAGGDAARARRLASRHHARTPALRTVLSRADGAGRLTRREREVATLTAGGLSNAEIAARLSLSTRTVEGHLLQVYDKLGVHTRAELAAVW